MLDHIFLGAAGGTVDLTAIPEQSHAGPTPFEYDVAFVGLGYVGLPTALSFVAAGKTVIGIDLSTARLEAIRAGRVDILSTDRDRLGTAMESGALQITGALDALAQAETVIICVPTPVDHHLVPDLKALAGACASVVERARTGQVILLTSTTYVGTTRDFLVLPLQRRGFRVGIDIFVAFSPERIDPGNSQNSQESVPRVVGGVTAACARRAKIALSAYAEHVHVVSTPDAAELTKLYENSFRAVNIALVNELADISRELNVEVMEVIDAASTKPYGFMAFLPGSGVGGHCIPCDPHYLLWQLKRQRGSAPLLEQAMVSIARRPRQVVSRARDLLAEHGKPMRGSVVVVVGVTYKPGVADIRESPGIEVLERLAAAGADARYVDALVPELELSDGTVLRSLSHEPFDSIPDLLVLNTVHPGFDHTWVVDQALILDATYRFDAAPHRATL